MTPRTFQTICLSLILVTGFGSSPIHAQPPLKVLRDAALASANELDAAAIPAAQPSRAGLLTAVDALRLHLTRTATPANAQAWLDYLEISELLDAIESEERSSTQSKLATRVVQKATGFAPGLEVPAVVRVREAASQFANAQRFIKGDAVVNALRSQLNRLGKQLDADGANLTAEQTRTLTLILDLLKRTEQDVSLFDATLRSFRHNNVHVMVGESLVRRIIDRAVQEQTPIRDCILGTRLIGDASLTGSVTANLQPSIGSIRIELALTGTVSSRNTGFNGPVRLLTSSMGQVHSTKRLTITESGIQLEPAVTSASLDSRIDAIQHRLKLVRRIAKKKAAEQKPAADRIARAKLIQRVSESFEEQVASTTSLPTPDLLGEIRPILRRLDLREPPRSISSTSQSIHLHALLRDKAQLGADRPAPGVPTDLDAAIQIHESVINNTIGAVLAGRTMTQSDLQQLARRAGMTPVASEDQKSFEIDFDAIRPVIFEARDGNLRFGIRGTRFSQGKRQLKRSLEIVANYQPIRTMDGQVLLERIGDTKIDFPGRKRLTVAESGLRGAIKNGFAGAFPKLLLDQPLTIPTTVKAEALRGQTYRAIYFDAQNGWLTLGVRQ